MFGREQRPYRRGAEGKRFGGAPFPDALCGGGLFPAATGGPLCGDEANPPWSERWASFL